MGDERSVDLIKLLNISINTYRFTCQNISCQNDVQVAEVAEWELALKWGISLILQLEGEMEDFGLGKYPPFVAKPLRLCPKSSLFGKTIICQITHPMKHIYLLLFVLLLSVSTFAQTRINSSFAFQTDPSKDYSLYIPSSYNASVPNKLMLGMYPFNTARWNGDPILSSKTAL